MIGTITNTNTVTAGSASEKSGGLNGLATAFVVIGVILFLVLVTVVAFFVTRAIRDRRRNHGEYRPQFEELHHAKDLPYLQPPAVEGLI